MKKTIYLLTTILCVFFISSCDVLDVEDYSGINPEIWNSESSATLYVNNLYNYLSTSHYQFVNTTDDASSYYPWGGNAANCDETNGATTFTQGTWGRDAVTYWDANTYDQIRIINIGLEALAESNLSETAKGRLEGEMCFIRAWKYWNLVLLYGGVPIIKNSIDLEDESQLDLPRNKTSECIDFICEDLDKAINGLPSSVIANERLRATRAAAAALKGRVLLFYASPQFNPNNDRARWERAYTANKQAKEICEADGFGLHDSFEKVFTEKQNKEAVFITKCYSAGLALYHGWENAVRPAVASISSGVRCSPTWNLVQAFPLKNGKLTMDPSSGYNSDYFWENRDDRFKYTIAYNGAEWPLTGMEFVSGYDENNNPITQSIQTIWTYTGTNTMGSASNSPFYCRKATDSSIHKDYTDRCTSDWIEIRFAEVLLNYAEAAYEYGDTNSAYEALKPLRARAGIEAGNDGFYGLKPTFGITPIEVIMNERLVELAFENKRFWDVRRRDMFNTPLGDYTPQLNGTQRLKIRIAVNTPTHTAAEINSMDRDKFDMSKYYEYFRAPVEVAESSAQRLNIPTTYNFFDIPSNIKARSQTLKATKGWDTGGEETFDPYE